MNYSALINWRAGAIFQRRATTRGAKRPAVSRLKRRLARAAGFAMKWFAAGMLFGLGLVTFLLAMGGPLSPSAKPMSAPAPVAKPWKAV